jgi:hypothetical protein
MIIIAGGKVMTARKKNQSIKKHIEEHEKNRWLYEYIRLSECSYDEALKRYNEVFNK